MHAALLLADCWPRAARGQLATFCDPFPAQLTAVRSCLQAAENPADWLMDLLSGRAVRESAAGHYQAGSGAPSALPQLWRAEGQAWVKQARCGGVGGCRLTALHACSQGATYMPGKGGGTRQQQWHSPWYVHITCLPAAAGADA
jgi:hypothetical protein